MLWLLAAVGMLWAEVSWAERIHGLGGFHRSADSLASGAVPAIRARRLGALWVFSHQRWSYCSSVGPWCWLELKHGPVIFISTGYWSGTALGKAVFSSYVRSVSCGLCAMRYASATGRRALWPSRVSYFFLAYLVFVATSRAAIAVAPVLLVLLGWRRFGWKGVMTACITVPVLATALWATSPNLRGFFLISVQHARAYSANAADNSIGEHIEFLRKSLSFVREAPLIGHGTGSIADLFRRSAIGQTGAPA